MNTGDAIGYAAIGFLIGSFIILVRRAFNHEENNRDARENYKNYKKEKERSRRNRTQ